MTAVNAGKHANASSEEHAEKSGKKCNCVITRSPDLASQNSHVNVPKRGKNANAGKQCCCQWKPRRDFHCYKNDGGTRRTFLGVRKAFWYLLGC